MSTIAKIRKAITFIPATPYYDGIGSNSKVWYNQKTKEWHVGNECAGDEAYIFKQICRRLYDDNQEAVKKVEKIFDMSYYE